MKKKFRIPKERKCWRLLIIINGIYLAPPTYEHTCMPTKKNCSLKKNKNTKQNCFFLKASSYLDTAKQLAAISIMA